MQTTPFADFPTHVGVNRIGLASGGNSGHDFPTHVGVNRHDQSLVVTRPAISPHTWG